MPRFHRRATTMAAGACAATLALGLAACSDSGSEPGDAAPAGTTPASASQYTTPLGGVCPETVVVQTGWWPVPSMGFLYQLLGPDPAIEKDANRVTGPLGGTGVRLEIRSGGPAVGFQPVSAVLAQDDEILLGLISTDESIKNSGNQPTVALFAPYETSPWVFIWGDPSLDFPDVGAIGRSGVQVLAAETDVQVAVFEREGLLDPARVDRSYQGSPERFVNADGKIAQVGFVDNEPYRLQHDVPQWGKPVKYLLHHDEYPVYVATVATRQDKKDANSACLTELVPLLQQAQRDYVADPGPTNELLLDVLDTLDTGGFGLSPGLLADANTKQKELRLIADGSDGVLGSFDTARVQELITRLTPVFESQGSAPKPGLTPTDLVTNEFLDTSVSLGQPTPRQS